MYIMHMVWGAIKRCIKKILWCDKQEELRECTGIRVTTLIGAGIVGLVLSPGTSKLATYFSSIFFSYTYFKDDELERVQFTMATILVVLAVWYFRNYDRKATLKTSKAQVNISEIQLKEQNILNACSDLNSDQTTKINIGIDRLVEMCKEDSTLYARIRQSLIERLEKCPLDEAACRAGSTRLHYAQRILQWLSKNMREDEPIDLSYSNFACQDFTIDIPFTRLFGTTPQRHVSFQQADLQGSLLADVIFPDANLQGASLQNVHLRDADLQKANLEDANLQDANLVGADLRNADLRSANLQGAKLQDTDLQNTKLQGADLQDAKLQNADLRGAKLQGANLENANLQGALVYSNTLEGASDVDETGVIWHS